jgi:hypothetical protein
VTILRVTQLDSTMTVEYKTTDPEQLPAEPFCLSDPLPRIQFVLVPAPVGAVVFKRVSN